MLLKATFPLFSLVAIVLGDPPISEDGLCAANSATGATCEGSEFGSCCSIYGFCGDSADYCAPDICDADFGECHALSTDGTCGISSPSGTDICTGSGFGDCCSTYGFCGASSLWCYPANCDPQFGFCPTTTTDGTCGPDTGTTCTGADFGSCCGSDNICGVAARCDLGCQMEFGSCEGQPTE